MKIEKYNIIIVAGQSNAQGYGEGMCLNLETEKANPRVKQLGRYGANFGKIIDASFSLEHVQNLTSFTHPSNPSLVGLVGWGMYLGNLLTKYIPEDEGILLVPCARGGSGFNTGTNAGFSPTTGAASGCTKWGVDSDLFNDLKNHTKIALTTPNTSGKKNSLIAVCWLQGEFDQAINNGLDHKPAFEKMVLAFNEFLTPYSDQVYNKDPAQVKWICGTSTRYWESRPGYSSIFGVEGTYGKSNLSQVVRIDLTNDGDKKMGTNLPTEDPDINEINYKGSGTRKVLSSSIRESHFGSMSNRTKIPQRFEDVLKPILKVECPKKSGLKYILVTVVIVIVITITVVTAVILYRKSASNKNNVVVNGNTNTTSKKSDNTKLVKEPVITKSKAPIPLK